MKKLGIINLNDSKYKLLLSQSIEQDTAYQWICFGIIDKVYEKEIHENQDEDIKNAKLIVNDTLSLEELPDNIKEVITEICYEQIKPNYFFDSAKTEEKINEALKSAPKIMIKKNQIIVKDGEPITQKQIQILTELGLVGERIGTSYLFSYIILAIYTFFIMALQIWYIKREYNKLYSDDKMMLLIILLNLLCIISTRTLAFISPFLMPVACSAILMTVLLDYKLSIIINSLNIALLSVVVWFNAQVIIVSLVVTLLVSILLKRVKGRNEIIYTTIYIVIAAAIITLTSGILLSNNVKKILSDMIISSSGTLISGVLAIGLLPFY